MFLFFDGAISESLAFITKPPENVIVRDDENATLTCSSNSTTAQGNSSITWKYDHDIISYTPCQSQHPAFIATSPNPRTDCNIVALAGGVDGKGISGSYRCTDGAGPEAVAMVIVLSK